jgi:hypothetical protein
MTMTSWGQDLAGLEATEKEYAGAIQTLQRGVAFYNYRVDVVKNKQAWLQLFNVVNQGLMTVATAISANDENFQKLQTAVGDNETQQAIQSKYQNTGVQYSELVGLASSTFAFWAVDKWLTDTRVWLNEVAEQAAADVSSVGASAGVLLIDGVQAVVSLPMVCIKLIFYVFRFIGSGLIVIYDKVAGTVGLPNWDDISSIQALYEKLGVNMERSWNSAARDLKSYGEQLYSDASQFKVAVEDAFSTTAAVGDGVTLDSLTVSLIADGSNEYTSEIAASGVKITGVDLQTTVDEADDLSSDMTDVAEATEEASSWMSSTLLAGASIVGLIGIDVIVGYWQGETQKGKYKDAIDSLNTKISSINDAATKLDSVNTQLNEQIAAMCKSFGETYNALAYLQTPVVTLDTNTTIIDNADWDAQLNLSDSQIDELVSGTYKDPYNWSSPTDASSNPYCTSIQPFSDYILAAQGALQQFSEICNYKKELINYISNQQSSNQTVSISSFWEMALMFSSSGGVIGNGDTAVDMNDAKTQKWISNLFAITSEAVAEVLSETDNMSWLIADFDQQNTVTAA